MVSHNAVRSPLAQENVSEVGRPVGYYPGMLSTVRDETHVHIECLVQGQQAQHVQVALDVKGLQPCCSLVALGEQLHGLQPQPDALGEQLRVAGMRFLGQPRLATAACGSNCSWGCIILHAGAGWVGTSPMHRGLQAGVPGLS